MVTLVNRAKMTAATTGTGVITLGTAVDGYQTFAAAGVSDADVVRYVIEDGDSWEIGSGTYTSSGTTLTRTVDESSDGGTAISLSGSAVVFVTAAGDDLQNAADMDQGVATTDSPEFAGVTLPSINGGPLAGFRNAIINGNFGVNQREVSGTVTLSAGDYGHDRWKAGSSGCTYTFATSENVTTITITAGSLVQVIEGENLFTGTYMLSFTGTAQGKIGGGSFSASGVTGSVTGGTNLEIEFNTGTVAQVQLEAGSIATPFERRPVGTELALCQRYYHRVTRIGGGGYTDSAGQIARAPGTAVFPVQMRTTPSVEINGTPNGRNTGNIGTNLANKDSHVLSYESIDAGSVWWRIDGDSYIAYDAEL